MINMLIVFIFFAVILFFGWKILIINHLYQVTSIIFSGANSGINTLLPFFHNPEIKKNLVKDWEFIIRYFFKVLCISQYQSTSEVFNLPIISQKQMPDVQRHITLAIITVAYPESPQEVKDKIKLIALTFTTQMDQIKANKEPTCFSQVIDEAAAQLINLLLQNKPEKNDQMHFRKIFSSAQNRSYLSIYRNISKQTIYW